MRFPAAGRRELGDLALVRGGTIEGRVASRSGGGGSRAKVRVYNESAGYCRVFETDGDGRFRLTHVPPGACRIRVTERSGPITPAQMIELAAAAPTTVIVVDGRVTRVDL